MTENEKRKEGDDLMTCFVIHVSLLSLHIFRNSCFTKRLAVTEDDRASSCRHVEEVERKYWDADIAVEAEMEKIVIQVTSSDEDTNTATECSDYSDTESADEECLS